MSRKRRVRECFTRRRGKATPIARRKELEREGEREGGGGRKCDVDRLPEKIGEKRKSMRAQMRLF